MADDRRAAKRFGRELARTRKLADMTQATLARAVGVSASHISHLEQGIRDPVLALLAKLDDALTTGGRLAQAWNELTGSGRATWLSEVAVVLRSARTVLDYQNAVFPGLIQVDEYAREVIAAGHPRPQSNEAAEVVGDRIKRAAAFTDAQDPLLWVVLDETVVTRHFTSPEARRAQLRHVVTLAESGRITVQVLQADCLGHPGMSGPFKVITPDDGPDVVYAESIHDGQLITAARDVEGYRLMYGRLQAAAMGPKDSLALIRRELDHA